MPHRIHRRGMILPQPHLHPRGVGASLPGEHQPRRRAGPDRREHGLRVGIRTMPGACPRRESRRCHAARCAAWRRSWPSDPVFERRGSQIPAEAMPPSSRGSTTDAIHTVFSSSQSAGEQYCKNVLSAESGPWRMMPLERQRYGRSGVRSRRGFRKTGSAEASYGNGDG
jgi:hypothetical protein